MKAPTKNETNQPTRDTPGERESPASSVVSGDEALSDSELGDEVAEQVEHLVGTDLRETPQRVCEWQLIIDHRKWLKERAVESRQAGLSRHADEYEGHFRKLDLAIRSGKTEGQILKMFSVERAAKAALEESCCDPNDEAKRVDAEHLCSWVAGRKVSLEEEEAIDRGSRRNRSGTRKKRASRIVNRLSGKGD